jgi:hypothetical protein
MPFFRFLVHFCTGKFEFSLFLIKVSNQLITCYSPEIRQHFGGLLHITVAAIYTGTVCI